MNGETAEGIYTKRRRSASDHVLVLLLRYASVNNGDAIDSLCRDLEGTCFMNTVEKKKSGLAAIHVAALKTNSWALWPSCGMAQTCA